MTFFEIFFIAGGAILLVMIALWLLSLAIKNASIVDIFWGSGYVLAAWLYFALTPAADHARAWLVVLLTTIWGLRLSAHIFWRNRGHGEDFRYAAWRKEAGQKWWWQSFFKVFLLQGLLLWLISMPLLAAQHTAAPANLNWLDFLAVIVWATGFFFEAVGDWQLARFKAQSQNSGKLLTTGLWRYTRHPNYFGDATVWWGFYLLAVAAGGWWTIFSPLLMTWLLLNVSGVALLEKSLSRSKPGYERYVARTNAFLPWFARENEQ